jgi:hypothetical protein
VERSEKNNLYILPSSEEKGKPEELIDEYDFVQKVLKYRTATMPDDLVQELKHQNDANRK